VCCSVLQCVAVCCSVLQCAAVCCSVLQCAAVCCNVLQGVCRIDYLLWSIAFAKDCRGVEQIRTVLRCVAVCCSIYTKIPTSIHAALLSSAHSPIYITCVWICVYTQIHMYTCTRVPLLASADPLRSNTHINFSCACVCVCNTHTYVHICRTAARYCRPT